MKKFSLAIPVLALAFVAIALALTGCDTGSPEPGNGTDNTPVEVQRMYDELKTLRIPGRSVKPPALSVTGVGNNPTGFNWATLDKFIDNYTAYPDHQHISSRNWTGVVEGTIKLDFYGRSGDGIEMWVFISIQGGEHYVIFAGNDPNARPFSEMDVGIMEDPTNPEQKWFFKWQ